MVSFFIDYFSFLLHNLIFTTRLLSCGKDINILKGKIIIIRTDIDTCYQRCIDRYKKNNPAATKEEIEKYSDKKKPLYKWYKFSNEFIYKINKK